MTITVRSSATDSGADRRWRVPSFDVLLATACFAVGCSQVLFPQVGLWEDAGSGSYRAADIGAWFLTFAACAPLAVRRRVPRVAFLVGMAALTAMVLADHLVGLLPYVCWILIYTVGTRAPARACSVAFAATVAALWLCWFSDYPGFDGNSAARNVAFFAACLIAGRFVAANRRSAATLIELAEQRSVVAAQSARAAVVEERLRLAQELHDIVAHSMSVISVQASMGSAAFDAQPHQARRALANIERTSSETLNELRGLLGVLRHDDGTRAGLAPSPTLRDIDTLIGNVGAAGVRCTLVTDGPFVLPVGVDAFAFRIVQEALTNVLKHADARSVQVGLHDSGSVLTVHVRDDGCARIGRPPGSAMGHGILGMRERVATFGGTFRAGPCDGGGFEVVATLHHLTQADACVPNGSDRNTGSAS